MYAIVEIAGQQFKVEKGREIFVHRLPGNEGDKVGFSRVLLIDNEGKIALGSPAVEDAAVTAEIIDHVRGDKVVVFKKKRRKGYQKRNGHRQDFTRILIDAIFEKGGSKAIAEAEKQKGSGVKATKSVAKAGAEAKTEVSAAKKAQAGKAKAAAKPKAGVKAKTEKKEKSPKTKTAAKKKSPKK